MSKLLYLECNSGISGDMMIGSLLDLGADREKLEKTLKSMGIHGYKLHFGRTKKCGLDAYDFDVILEEHDHVHRHLKDVYQLIDAVNAGENVKNTARKIFRIVAEAEAKVHGTSVEEVHFHEVGAVDSIIDIIGTAVCLDDLGIEEVVVSPLTEGCGTIRCQHGIMPVPAPATAQIAAMYGLNLKITSQPGEMVTPTGAAIVAAIQTSDTLPEVFRIQKMGMGAGNKDFPHANVLRSMILETEKEQTPDLWVLESNIDDCSGERLGFTMELLLGAGAADVWYTPVYMKKNRPAYKLSVLCEKTLTETVEDIIFRQTTTIGIRRYPVKRTVLEREIIQADTLYGKADIKVCTRKGEKRYYPEYDSVSRICKTQGQDYDTVYQEIKRAGEEAGKTEEK